MFKTKDILRIGYFESSNASKAQENDFSLRVSKFKSLVIIGCLGNIHWVSKYSFSIAPVLIEYCFSIERVLKLYYRSSLGVFQVHSRYINKIFIEHFGRLKGLIYKFAIFLGRRPP